MMKKLICLLVLLAMCVSMALPVLAVENNFVPSIENKDGPPHKDGDLDGDDVTDCIVVSTVEQAKNKETDITQEDRDLLVEVYEKLKDGSMTLPLDFDYVIRDLVDVSFKYEDCRQKEDHGNKPEKLKQDGVTLTITFDMGVKPDEKVTVLVYIDGQWVPVESVTNNGDGTLTVVFEDICPVVFVVEDTKADPTPPTGDTAGKWLILAVSLMIVSAAAIIVLLTTKSRKTH